MKRDFLMITDFSSDEITETFKMAEMLKKYQKEGKEYKPLKNKTMAMIFAKPSARTRISFETGMYQLGGHALYLAPTDIGIGKREAIKDIAKVISRYNDIIMARLFEHRHIEELAKYASVPVINGLTDLTHPCQVMSDLFTIFEHKGTYQNLKIAFVGDGSNNVANSWVNIASRIPLDLTIVTPKNCLPEDNILNNAIKSGISTINIEHDPLTGVKEADVIYTDVWVSMGQESLREEKIKNFRGFQVNECLVKNAKKDVIVMHCLPAHRGEEITDDVIDGPHSVVYDEAENRMHVQKAIILKLFNIF
ncbi:MAG: ornithine carbamoyltransferase [Candidatus Marinimicrobia bacterium]|nr:ornithine carbamoyltransferase [Candidatus Neomarinimicrobiota bacterium]